MALKDHRKLKPSRDADNRPGTRKITQWEEPRPAQPRPRKRATKRRVLDDRDRESPERWDGLFA